AADGDARSPHTRERLETILICPRRNDLPVEFWRRVEIMVVGRETGAGKSVSLALREHPQGAAGLQSERADTSHHLEHPVEILPRRHLTPRRTHAEPRRALISRMPRGRQHF